MTWPAPTGRPLARTGLGGPLHGKVIPVSEFGCTASVAYWVNGQLYFKQERGHGYYARFGLEPPGTYKWYTS